MFTEYDGISIGDILHALNFVLQLADDFKQPDIDHTPGFSHFDSNIWFKDNRTGKKEAKHEGRQTKTNPEKDSPQIQYRPGWDINFTQTSNST